VGALKRKKVHRISRGKYDTGGATATATSWPIVPLEGIVHERARCEMKFREGAT
jgi:hypothetical protein